MVNLLLNVSFGILILMPQGWLFMILIMLLESFISSELLCKRKFDGRITATVFFANFVSGLFGIIITLILNGGWWLVVWFPWVSSHEVDFSIPNELTGFIIYYIVAFPDFVIVSPKSLRQRVLLFSDVLPSALFGCKSPCSEVA